jgi:translation initiation factor IF-2
LSDDKSEADLTAELVEEQLEREIIRKQRKQVVGKDKNKETEDGEEIQKKKQEEAKAKVSTVELPEVISVKEFSEKIGINAALVIGKLMKNGILANINQQIDFVTAQIIADDFGASVKKKQEAAEYTDILERNMDVLLKEDNPAELKSRPPVVSVMGHVDHGKTSLLDAIRKANVVATEAGGITQHIGAYQVEHQGKRITFLDTPGHQAFTAMRARGAQATDIAILVVAADDGVQPQTVEALNHAKDAGIPIIVAINKMDREGANPDKVKAELAEYDLSPEEWGGKTIMVPVSAIKKMNIDKLLEALLLVAEVEELKANPNRAAVGTVVESHLDPGLGPVATILVNTGSLKIGDAVVCGDAYGKIKTMHDHTGKSLKKLVPSDAARISGLSKTPLAGDVLQVVADERIARDQATKIELIRENQRLSARGFGSDQIATQIRAGRLKKLKLILKVDTKGSLEAIKQVLGQIESDEVTVNVVHSGVGPVNDSDVMMAAAGGALVFAFHVGADQQVKKMAERSEVEIKEYRIIYNLVDDVKRILSGLLTPERIEVDLGEAQVMQVFFAKKKEQIIGLKITNGKLINKCKLKIFRNGAEVGMGEILSLKRVDNVVDEIKAGNDCGIRYTGDIQLVEGDIVKAFKIEERERSLN